MSILNTALTGSSCCDGMFWLKMFRFTWSPGKHPMIRSHHLAAILTTTPSITALSSAELLALMQAVAQEAGLHPVGEATATFVPQGVSAVLLLEESHVALHIWPENQKVAVDIHVCDYHQDNLPKAEKLADLLAQRISGEGDRPRWNYLSTTG